MGSLVPEEVVARFHDSFERVRQHPDFFDVFYERFLSCSDEVAAKFNGVDLGRLKSMVREALYLKLLATDGNVPARERLVQLGMKHAAMQIRPELYELWLDALMSVVEEMDPRYDARIEQSWRDVLALGIGIMLAAYPPA